MRITLTTAAVLGLFGLGLMVGGLVVLGASLLLLAIGLTAVHV